MATLKQLRAAAAKHGAELEIDRDFQTVEAWLPDGQQWPASAAQCIVVCHRDGKMSEVYDDMIEYMS